MHHSNFHNKHSQQKSPIQLIEEFAIPKIKYSPVGNLNAIKTYVNNIFSLENNNKLKKISEKYKIKTFLRGLHTKDIQIHLSNFNFASLKTLLEEANNYYSNNMEILLDKINNPPPPPPSFKSQYKKSTPSQHKPSKSKNSNKKKYSELVIPTKIIHTFDIDNVPYFPNEIVMKIMSYISYDIIIKVSPDITFFSTYMQYLFPKMEISYISGIFNNTKGKCFICSDILQHIYVLCMCDCSSILLNNNLNYPKICYNCCDQKFQKKKQLLSNCFNCSKKTQHLTIRDYYA